MTPLLLIAMLSGAPTGEEAITKTEGIVVEAEDGDRRIWYGWQLITADVVSTGAFVLALAGNESDVSPFIALIAVGSHTLVGPLIHLAHREWKSSIASAALRLALPGLAGAVAAGACAVSCGSRGSLIDEPIIAALTVGLIAIPVAGIIDAAVLPYKSLETKRRRRTHGDVEWAGGLVPIPGGGALQVMGTF